MRYTLHMEVQLKYGYIETENNKFDAEIISVYTKVTLKPIIIVNFDIFLLNGLTAKRGGVHNRTISQKKPQLLHLFTIIIKTHTYNIRVSINTFHHMCIRF